MSLGVKWGDPNNTEEPSGFIYLDSVVSYSQDHRGQVTKHPVDSGASITDHFIKENSIYTISGVISGTDLSAIPFGITDQEGNKPLNAQRQVEPVSLDFKGSKLLQYIPDSIGQFLKKSSPTINVDQTTVRTDLNYEILVKDLLRGILNGVKYDPKKDRTVSNIQTVDLYEFDGTNIRDIISNLVITNFRIREDAETGDALFLDLTLEQVTFATLERVQLSQDVQDSFKKKAATPAKKTSANSTPKDCAAAQESGDTSAPSTDSDLLLELNSTKTNFGLDGGPLI